MEGVSEWSGVEWSAMAVAHTTAGGPAATPRAAAPSRGSGYCACHEEDSQRHQRRQ